MYKSRSIRNSKQTKVYSRQNTIRLLGTMHSGQFLSFQLHHEVKRKQLTLQSLALVFFTERSHFVSMQHASTHFSAQPTRTHFIIITFIFGFAKFCPAEDWMW